ncbi:jg2811 [Pararge aegeria aegeria]|uniref:Jg2811 protein n=1 Tax=Pararge aegeria aegeria TaxID=348720 RepID=A0A8S4RZM2_9NEOP|nr:jg2811 [Pararge aegeria aegeria]
MEAGRAFQIGADQKRKPQAMRDQNAFKKQLKIQIQFKLNLKDLAIKESYGHRGMNIYVRRSADALRLCTGLYGSDNVIERLLIDPSLTSLPHLIMPEVTFALASNFLRMEAGLSKMILEAKYILFRNQSDVVYSAEEQTVRKSPFSYVQLQPYGELAIVAEDCTIDGYVLAKLSGMTINLGHDSFRVKNCKFSVEISAKQQPPIIAPYFTVEQTKQLQYLLSRPIRAELMPKLQAAVFSFINTSLVFGDYLPKFREYQNNIFKETSKYVNDIAIALDNKTVEKNLATLDAESVSLTWKSKVRGSTTFGNETALENHDFVTEIHDVSVDFAIDLERREARFEVVIWR